MKQVVNGKRYDTETAVQLESWDNGASGGDLDRCEESLYRTKNGAYFLHGVGGAMSRWSRSDDGGRSSACGEGIEPLTPAEALVWLESHKLDVPDGAPEIAALVVEA